MTTAGSNAFMNFIGTFNIQYTKRHTYLEITETSNKILAFIAFLKQNHLIYGIHFYSKRRLRIFLKYSQHNLPLFNHITLNSRPLGVTLKTLRHYIEIFNITYFPLLVLYTKKGMLSGYTAYRYLVSGQICGLISK